MRTNLSLDQSYKLIVIQQKYAILSKLLNGKIQNIHLRCEPTRINKFPDEVL